jgi:hypothetical protein
MGAMAAATASADSGVVQMIWSELSFPGEPSSSCAQPMSMKPMRVTPSPSSGATAAMVTVLVRPPVRMTRESPGCRASLAAMAEEITSFPPSAIHASGSSRHEAPAEAPTWNGAAEKRSMPTILRYSPGCEGMVA